MTFDQALIAYLTGAVLTLCYLGVSARLPGQKVFEDKMRWMTREKLTELLMADPDDPEADEDAILTWTRRWEMFVVLPGLILFWPLYWILNFAITVYVAFTPTEEKKP